jgi:hypothetical protein
MIRTIAAALTILGLTGCGGCSDDAAKPASQDTTAQPPSPTDKARAANAIGYDGDALQQGLDRMRSDAQHHTDQTQQAGSAQDSR